MNWLIIAVLSNGTIDIGWTVSKEACLMRSGYEQSRAEVVDTFCIEGGKIPMITNIPKSEMPKLPKNGVTL